jgi:F-type H+-transporting ATPase subunit b
MPQIAQLAGTYSSQIFWMLVFFGFIFFVIGRGMVPRVMATVDARDQQIAGDLAAATAARDDADAQEAAWRISANDQRAQAQTVIAKAKVDAAKASEASLAKANAGIETRLAEAEQRIAAAHTGALAQIEAVASEAAGDIVARLTGKSVDAKVAADAVKVAFHG